MSKAIIAIIIILSLSLLSLLFTVSTRMPEVLGTQSNLSQQEIIKAVNQKRLDIGIPPLTQNQKLSSAAAAKAIDIANNDYWNHYSATGAAPWDFILAAGYQYQYAGENLARNFTNSQSVVDAWYKSPAHNQILSSNQYQDIGVAVLENVDLKDTHTLIVMLVASKAESNANSQYTTSHMLDSPVQIVNRILLVIVITLVWLLIYALINKHYKDQQLH